MYSTSRNCKTEWRWLNRRNPCERSRNQAKCVRPEHLYLFPFISRSLLIPHEHKLIYRRYDVCMRIAQARGHREIWYEGTHGNVDKRGWKIHGNLSLA